MEQAVMGAALLVLAPALAPVLVLVLAAARRRGV
jgi:hypothetical protein